MIHLDSNMMKEHDFQLTKYVSEQQQRARYL